MCIYTCVYGHIWVCMYWIHTTELCRVVNKLGWVTSDVMWTCVIETSNRRLYTPAGAWQNYCHKWLFIKRRMRWLYFYTTKTEIIYDNIITSAYEVWCAAKDHVILESIAFAVFKIFLGLFFACKS